VRLEASPDPVRVRAAYVTDADIREMPRSSPGPVMRLESTGERMAH